MSSRLAILSSPRSGNMWLRRLVTTACGACELSADTPAGVPWDELPAACVLQLHWPPDEELVTRLDHHGFRTVVVARHPLDVLVSILQFAQHEPRTARWLNGEQGNELSLVGATPSDSAFREYGLSARARALLCVTPAWWSSPALQARVRYEDLVARPADELERLADELGLEPIIDVDEAVSQNSLGRLQAQTSNRHFWRGRPGLWHSLLPADLALELAGAHADSLDAFGYTVEPDPELTSSAARAAWHELESPQPAAGPADEFPLARRVELNRLPADDAVGAAYRFALRRPPDPAGRGRAEAAIADGTLSPAGFLHELVTSSEGQQVRELDDAIAFARWARTHEERPRNLHATPMRSEMAVAIPWALSRVRDEDDVLDVGTAYADPGYLAALLDLDVRRLRGVDLAACDVPGLEMVTADVRRLPFARNSFALVLCLATLHHVGRDNRLYGLDVERDPAGIGRALVELRRVLRPDGRLLVSVPAGETQDLGLFVQLGVGEWLDAFTAAGFYVFEHEVYELATEGWGSVRAPAAGLRYAERGSSASAVLCAELRPGRLRQSARHAAAAARNRVLPRTVTPR